MYALFEQKEIKMAKKFKGEMMFLRYIVDMKTVTIFNASHPFNSLFCYYALPKSR
jgi:hypothetical protein